MAYRTKICDQGGFFNVSRPTVYSAETCTFLNNLIKESHLTTLQRKSLQGWLRSGNPPSTPPVSPKTKTSMNPIRRYYSSKPRTLKDIVESGAYEPVAYVPNMKIRNYSAEKEKLQNIMAYGQVTKIDPIAMQKPGIKEKPKECTEEELIDSVLSEIEDREKFLSDMELLGQASKYYASIIHEICDRIKKLEVFFSKTPCSYRLTDVQDLANKYRKLLESPKNMLKKPTPLSVI